MSDIANSAIQDALALVVDWIDAPLAPAPNFEDAKAAGRWALQTARCADDVKSDAWRLPAQDYEATIRRRVLPEYLRALAALQSNEELEAAPRVGAGFLVDMAASFMSVLIRYRQAAKNGQQIPLDRLQEMRRMGLQVAESVPLEHRDAAAWHTLGQLLEFAGDRDSALSAFERVFELEPDGGLANVAREAMADLRAGRMEVFPPNAANTQTSRGEQPMSTEQFRISPDGEYTYDVEWDRSTGRVRANFRGEWISCGMARSTEQVRHGASATLLMREAKELKPGAMAGSFVWPVLGSLVPSHSPLAQRASTMWERICDRLPEPLARKQHFPHSCANAVLREFLRRDGRTCSDAQVAGWAGREDRIGWLSPDDLVRALNELGYTGSLVTGAQAASLFANASATIAFRIVWPYSHMAQRGAGSIAHAVLIEPSAEGVEIWDPSPLRRSHRGMSTTAARRWLLRSKAALVIE